MAMQNAIDAIKNGKMGWLKASKTFGIPQATLRRRAQDTNKNIKGISKGLGRFTQTFDKNLEREIVDHL